MLRRSKFFHRVVTFHSNQHNYHHQFRLEDRPLTIVMTKPFLEAFVSAKALTRYKKNQRKNLEEEDDDDDHLPKLCESLCNLGKSATTCEESFLFLKFLSRNLFDYVKDPNAETNMAVVNRQMKTFRDAIVTASYNIDPTSNLMINQFLRATLTFTRKNHYGMMWFGQPIVYQQLIFFAGHIHTVTTARLFFSVIFDLIGTEPVRDKYKRRIERLACATTRDLFIKIICENLKLFDTLDESSDEQSRIDLAKKIDSMDSFFFDKFFSAVWSCARQGDVRQKTVFGAHENFISVYLKMFRLSISNLDPASDEINRQRSSIFLDTLFYLTHKAPVVSFSLAKSKELCETIFEAVQLVKNDVLFFQVASNLLCISSKAEDDQASPHRVTVGENEMIKILQKYPEFIAELFIESLPTIETLNHTVPNRTCLRHTQRRFECMMLFLSACGTLRAHVAEFNNSLVRNEQLFNEFLRFVENASNEAEAILLCRGLYGIIRDSKCETGHKLFKNQKFVDALFKHVSPFVISSTYGISTLLRVCSAISYDSEEGKRLFANPEKRDALVELLKHSTDAVSTCWWCLLMNNLCFNRNLDAKFLYATDEVRDLLIVNINRACLFGSQPLSLREKEYILKGITSLVLDNVMSGAVFKTDEMREAVNNLRRGKQTKIGKTSFQILKKLGFA